MWYGVRSVIDDGEGRYEERVVLIKARSDSKAFSKAKKEAKAYAAAIDGRYLGLLQLYTIDEKPGAGTEVFSLIRDSTLAPDEYLDRFFDTGSEHEQNA